MKQILVTVLLGAMIFMAPTSRERTVAEEVIEEPVVAETIDISEVDVTFDDWGSGKTLLGFDIPEIRHELVEYEMYYTNEDVTAAAQMMLGEAGCNWISDDERMACLWTVLNRVDIWGGTVKGQIASANQFLGYSPLLPAYEHYVELAIDVMTRWSLEKQGIDISRELPADYLWFTANAEGTHNVFRNSYSSDQNTEYLIFE